MVVDASSLVDYLVRDGETALWVRSQLRAAPDLHAPELIDAETLQAMRGLVLRGIISSDDATTAISDLIDARVVRYPHRPLLDRAWALRGGFTIYDALYVALAEALGATLVTTDRRLARAVTTVPVVAPNG
jgi:predicted nucleic acid-binding protein